jgi:arsenate reductase
MKFKFYEYEKCSTCIKARKWMDTKGIAYERVAIREQPPTCPELMQLLASHDGNLKKLFNTSGADYRDPAIKKLLPNLSVEETLDLLSKRGNLIKRPVLIGQNLAMQGFKPDQWGKALG